MTILCSSHTARGCVGVTRLVWYEIWTLNTGNIVADYDSGAATLAEVRAFVDVCGREAVADWVLARNVEGERDFQRIAAGSVLAEHALRVRFA